MVAAARHGTTHGDRFMTSTGLGASPRVDFSNTVSKNSVLVRACRCLNARTKSFVCSSVVVVCFQFIRVESVLCLASVKWLDIPTR